jgi:hypothetical protein
MMLKHVRKIMFVTMIGSFVIPTYTVMGMEDSPQSRISQIEQRPLEHSQWKLQSRSLLKSGWQLQLYWQSSSDWHNETYPDAFKPKVRKKRI